MEINNIINELRQKVILKVDVGKENSKDDVMNVIHNEIREFNYKSYVPLEQRVILAKAIYNSIFGMDVLEELINNNEITEIMVNGKDSIYIEKKGEILSYENTFSSEERLDNVIQQIVAKINRRVNEASPIADARLIDGSRVNIVLKPIALNGPIVTIRKFGRDVLTMNDLLKMGSITNEAIKLISNLVTNGYNIFVSGGTGTGKTTFLNAISQYIGKNERVITIEDSAELNLSAISNIVRLETREANIDGNNKITIRDLLKTSLRMRPDRIIIGEVRGPEALDLIQAMNTGHDGSMSTGHANSPKDMISRLETMILMGVDIPLVAIRTQIASAIDVIIHLERDKKKRRVSSIVQVIGMNDNNVQFNTLFKSIKTKTSEGNIIKELVPDNKLINKVDK